MVNELVAPTHVEIEHSQGGHSCPSADICGLFHQISLAPDGSQRVVRSDSLECCFPRLPTDYAQSAYSGYHTTQAHKKQGYVWGIFGTKETLKIALWCSMGPLALYGGSLLFNFVRGNHRRHRRFPLSALAVLLIAARFGAFLFPIYWHDACEEYRDCQSFPHYSAIVPREAEVVDFKIRTLPDKPRIRHSKRFSGKLEILSSTVGSDHVYSSCNAALG
jgi:hypothetical protein